MTAAVKGLDNLDRLVPVIANLEDDTPHTASLIVHTLRDRWRRLAVDPGKGSWSSFTPELKDAWAAVYALITTTMQDAARIDQAAA